MSTTINSEESAGVRIIDAEPPHISLEPEKSVSVIFTSCNLTVKALEKAAEMAKPLGANIVVVAVQAVPYSVPLDRPPVPMEFVMRRFEEAASRYPEKIQVFGYLCRDPMEAFKRILNHHSPVVMGIRKRWWPTRDEKLSRRLRRAGYDVISVNQE
jgi:hypothetical protein